MAKAGRNDPCACGSGKKAKRCCGVARGPSEEALARAFLSHQAAEWAPTLLELTQHEIADLETELIALPRYHLALQLPLPRVLPPALERARQLTAVDADEVDDADIHAAIATVDTWPQRAALARAVLALHDDGHQLDCDLTALAVVDLAEPEHSALLVAALYHALAVASGTETTPTGLYVAGGT